MAVSATLAFPTKVSIDPNGRARAAWEDVVSPVKAFLGQVTQRLMEQVAEFDPEIAGYAQYALDNQGKQLRPALVALAGGAFKPLRDEHISLATVIEMIHLATLVHDDIMDGASLRRGRATLAKRWGVDVAVLVGDCLFAQALQIAANFDTPDVCRAVANSTHIVCAGEILQGRRRRRWNLSRSDYFKVLEMKTAELFGLCCELGGRLSDAPVDARQSLRRYGIALGTAYQVYDDILDVYGEEDDAGKSLGTDLSKGRVTLPLLVFLERAPEVDRSRMIAWLEDWDPVRFPQVRALLDTQDALGESRKTIDRLLNTACDALSDIPETPESRALRTLPGFLVQQSAILGV